MSDLIGIINLFLKRYRIKQYKHWNSGKSNTDLSFPWSVLIFLLIEADWQQKMSFLQLQSKRGWEEFSRFLTEDGGETACSMCCSKNAHLHRVYLQYRRRNLLEFGDTWIYHRCNKFAPS